MKNHNKEFPIVKMSDVLNVSPSGYYEWLDRPPSNREVKKSTLQKEIKKEYENHKGMAGSPTITEHLKDKDEYKNISQTRVSREMKALGIKAKSIKKKHWHPALDEDYAAENKLARQFV